MSQRWIDAKAVHSIEEYERTRLRGVVRHETDAHGRFVQIITTDNVAHIIARHDEPRSPLEQMERLLVLLAERSPYFGATAEVDSWEAMMVRIYLSRLMETHWTTFVQALADEGYVKRKADRVTLTHRGWTAAQSASRTMRSGNQAFVAMWFHRSMDSLFDVGIAPALRACGYSPYMVNRGAHNNKIDDEIIANILSSRLFVGDLTGMRPNVFYEAGFAHGNKIPVLLTCNDSFTGCFLDAEPDLDGDPPAAQTLGWFKQISDRAFDVRQHLITGWKDSADLAKSLETRIRALQLALPVPAKLVP